jgi:hypothetical protein
MTSACVNLLTTGSQRRSSRSLWILKKATVIVVGAVRVVAGSLIGVIFDVALKQSSAQSPYVKFTHL